MLVSVSQLAAKLQAVNLEVWKIFAIWSPVTYAPIVGSSSSTPGYWDHSQNLMDHNFAALWPTETNSASLKYLNLLLIERASMIFKIDFTLSNWLHSHSAYLVSGPYSFFETVSKQINKVFSIRKERILIFFWMVSFVTVSGKILKLTFYPKVGLFYDSPMHHKLSVCWQRVMLFKEGWTIC